MFVGAVPLVVRVPALMQPGLMTNGMAGMANGLFALRPTVLIVFTMLTERVTGASGVHFQTLVTVMVCAVAPMVRLLLAGLKMGASHEIVPGPPAVLHSAASPVVKGGGTSSKLHTVPNAPVRGPWLAVVVVVMLTLPQFDVTG